MDPATLIGFVGVTALLVAGYMIWCVQTVARERHARITAESNLERAEASWKVTLRCEEQAYERLRQDHESLIAHAYVRQGNRFVRASRWPVN